MYRTVCSFSCNTCSVPGAVFGKGAESVGESGEREARRSGSQSGVKTGDLPSTNGVQQAKSGVVFYNATLYNLYCIILLYLIAAVHLFVGVQNSPER